MSLIPEWRDWRDPDYPRELSYESVSKVRDYELDKYSKINSIIDERLMALLIAKYRSHYSNNLYVDANRFKTEDLINLAVYSGLLKNKVRKNPEKSMLEHCIESTVDKMSDECSLIQRLRTGSYKINPVLRADGKIRRDLTNKVLLEQYRVLGSLMHEVFSILL